MKKSFILMTSIVLVLCISLTGCGILDDLSIEEVTRQSSTTEQITGKIEYKRTVSRIYYNTLSEGKKAAYDNIYKGIMGLEEEFYVSESYSSDEIFDVLYYVLNDNPEIFWTNGRAVFSSNGNMTLKYSLTSEEVSRKTSTIKAKTQQIMGTISPSGDDYSRALAVFDYIAHNTVYNEQAYASESKKKGYNPIYSIEGALINSSAVCSGYTKAYQYLLSLTGIKSTLVSGKSNDDSHAWLLIELDGKRYYSDVTWADQTESKTCEPHINHYYFAMNTKQLLRDHTIDRECDMFECVSMADNYYVREGLYFSAYDYDAVLNACIAQEEKSEKGYIELFISNNDEYEKAKASLVDDFKAEHLGKKVLGKKCTSFVDSNSGFLILF